MKIHPKLKQPIKAIALGIGMLADGVMLFVCCVAQASDLASQIAFATVGITIILLIPITYEEDARKLWACLASIAIFFDTSYLLTATHEKSVVAASVTQADLKPYNDAIAKSQTDVDTQTTVYNKALFDPSIGKDTQKGIEEQLNLDRQILAAKQQAKDDHLNQITNGESLRQGLTADKIFSAILLAITEGRILQLIVYAMFGVIIQGIIVFSIDEQIIKKTFLQRVKEMIKPIEKSKKGRPAGSKNKPKNKVDQKSSTPKPLVDAISESKARIDRPFESGEERLI